MKTAYCGIRVTSFQAPESHLISSFDKCSGGEPMRYLVRSTALSLLLLGSAVEAATVTLTWTAPTLRSDNTTALPATQIAGADVYDDFACATAPCVNPNGVIIGSVTG